jgi:uncharacterized protein (DUF433 family)
MVEAPSAILETPAAASRARCSSKLDPRRMGRTGKAPERLTTDYADSRIAEFSTPDKVQLMIDWSACPAVERSADTLSGAWRFKNTRVPVKALFENLESGATVDQFLDWFPGVNREQVLAVLEFAEKSLAVT